MTRILTAVFLMAALGLFGCSAAKQNNTTGESRTNSATDAKKDVPKTEKVGDGDFVESESGTEKAKPEAGKANVQGKVLFNEKPVPNVEVKVCEKFNRYLGGCDGESYKTKTDAGGEYLIANIPPKVYEGLIVQVFDTKNYIFATKGFGISSAKYKFEADQTFFAPETNLFKDDLKIQNPKPKAKADAPSLEFKWDAYPDAAYYKLSVSPDKYESDSTSIAAQKIEGATNYKPDKPLQNGLYRIRLEAFNANDVKLAESKDGFEFTVTGGESSGAANSGQK